MKENIFQDEKTQIMFENEEFTSLELKPLWNGKVIESRKFQGIKYILRDGKIMILETR